MPKSTAQRRAIHAMRGNTGVGKSAIIAQGVIPELEPPVPTVDPDRFKSALLAETGPGIIGRQVQDEAVMLSRRFLAQLLDAPAAEFPNIVIDKRLLDVDNVRALAEEARRRNAELNVFDIDAPLEQSLIEVLLREISGAAAVVPFDVVGRFGFVPARKNRRGIIKLFRADPKLGRYELYATTPSGDLVLVARVAEGKLEIADRELFAEVTDGDALAEVDRLADTRITAQEISRVTGGFEEGEFKRQVVQALGEYEGQTWREALDGHARWRPVQ